MINKIYVIQDSGKLFYYYNNSDLEGENDQDPIMVSGFFTALKMFAEEAIETARKLTKINFENTDYYFMTQNGRNYVAETDFRPGEVSDDDLYLLITTLASVFEYFLMQNVEKIHPDRIIKDVELDFLFKNKISVFMNQNINFAQYIAIFEEQHDVAEFSYLVEIENNYLGKTISSAKERKYYKMMKSTFFQEWVEKVFSSKTEFAYIFHSDTFIITINLYDTILCTIGMKMENIDKNHQITSLKTAVEFLKNRAVNLGEQILSM
jgi:hypothetical protein